MPDLDYTLSSWLKMLRRLESGMCFYCAAEHTVPGWVPSTPKPARRYRMCLGVHKQWSQGEMVCSCDCGKEVEYLPMQGYSNQGQMKGRNDDTNTEL